MTNSSINRKVALLSIGIVILLVLDTYIVTPIVNGELFIDSSHKYIPEARRSGLGHTNFYVYSASRHRYKVPEEIYLELNSVRDSFYIYKTGLFRTPLKIKYNFENQNYVVNIGMLNSGKACQIFLIYASLFSILNLFPFLIIRPRDLNQNLLFIGFFLALATLVVYFWWA